MTSLLDTLGHAAEMRPDRIALFGYAHVPHIVARQRRIDASALPADADRFMMANVGHDFLVAQGYRPVGFDHFALPHDPVAIAARTHTLNRNFQGYSTQPDCDLIALGVSAIGRIGATYSQNAKTLEEYYLSLIHISEPTRPY